MWQGLRLIVGFKIRYRGKAETAITERRARRSTVECHKIMKRTKIEYDQPVEIAMTPRQRNLILEHAMIGLDVTRPLQMALVKGKKLIVRLTLDDLDEINGYIAAEANHTDDKKLQRELDQLFELLQTTMESYDDGMWQGEF
jgi:hypothetical protein